MAAKKSARKPSKTKARKVVAKRRTPVATLTVPRLGHYWLGQGGVAYDIEPGRDGGPDHVLVAASDKRGNLKVLKASMGSYGTTIGADSYLDGQANAKKLRSVNSPLEKVCAGVESDGHKDFFPPAQCQVNTLRAHLYEKVKDIGWVLSSTEYSSDNAWCQNFGVGGQNFISKGYEYSVFPVRRVPVSR